MTANATILPTRLSPVTAAAPQRNLLIRTWHTVFIERRMPYRLAKALDRLVCACGFTEKQVSAGGCEVIVRRLTCDEDFVENILNKCEYTPPGFEIDSADTVVDIGGNIGTFALLAARRAVTGRVITIEPDRDNFALLQRNLVLNGMGNVTAIRAAVAREQGTVTLNCATQGGFHSILEDRKRADGHTQVVDSVRLQDVFDEQRIVRCDFLKVDCEGAEHQIFLNLPASYFARIQKISMEWHGAEDRDERLQEGSRLVSCLMDHGFHIQAYIEFVGFRGGMLRASREPNDN